MHDPADFRVPPTSPASATEEAKVITPLRPPPLGATEVATRRTVPDERAEAMDESLKRALDAIPLGKTPEWYARMSAVHSHRSANASAEAFEMAGRAFSEASAAKQESIATRKFVQQMLEDNPALYVKAKRTVSGSLKAVPAPVILSVPPPPPPVEMPANRSPTGSNFTVPLEVIENLKKQIEESQRISSEREAAERARGDLLLQQRQEREIELAEADATRKKWTFIVGTTVGVLTLIGGGIAYFIQHWHP
jgi:hypothetical protein